MIYSWIVNHSFWKIFSETIKRSIWRDLLLQLFVAGNHKCGLGSVILSLFAPKLTYSKFIINMIYKCNFSWKLLKTDPKVAEHGFLGASLVRIKGEILLKSLLILFSSRLKAFSASLPNPQMVVFLVLLSAEPVTHSAPESHFMVL